METTILEILNKNKLDISELENKLDIKIDGLTFGMSQFQINHFVLNKQEFPTPYAQFIQARIEINSRLNTFIDLYYQYRECLAKTMLAKGRIQKIEEEEGGFPALMRIFSFLGWKRIYPQIKDAKIELQNIEIEKNTLRLNSIRAQAEDKLRELQIFYETYKDNIHFENDAPEKIKEEEEKYWKIKSAYYTELRDRYGLTPSGFLSLPHEEGGLEKLIEITKAVNKNK